MNSITSPVKKQNIKRKTFKALMFLGLLAGALNSQAQINTFKIHVGLIYPISSNGKQAPLDTNNLSIHLIAGVSSVEKGFAFAGLSNIVRNNTYGTLFAGFSNHVIQKAEGVLFAGFANTYGLGNGAAFAGFANIAHGNVNGLQFAGFANVAKNMNGAQFAGFSNTAKNVTASQFAGFANTAQNVKGSQFAGFINIAKNTKGSQFAGFINIAKKVKGAQIAGFINIADSSDYPIGIVNFVKKGEKSLGISMDENQTAMLTFRSGGKVLYGILGVGYNFKNKDEIYAFEAGFGAHFFQSNIFRVNAELTASGLESFENGEYFRSSFKVFPALRLFKQLELFAGPSFNYTSTNSAEGLALNANHKTFKTWQHTRSSYQQTLSIGYSGGLHFIF